VIPVAGKKIKEPRIAAVAKSNVDDLRRRTIQQCPLVEIDILANDSKIFYLASFQISLSLAVKRLRSNRCSA
jgi:hypothetical protein